MPTRTPSHNTTCQWQEQRIEMRAPQLVPRRASLDRHNVAQRVADLMIVVATASDHGTRHATQSVALIAGVTAAIAVDPVAQAATGIAAVTVATTKVRATAIEEKILERAVGEKPTQWTTPQGPDPGSGHVIDHAPRDAVRVRVHDHAQGHDAGRARGPMALDQGDRHQTTQDAHQRSTTNCTRRTRLTSSRSLHLTIRIRIRSLLWTLG